MLLERAPVLEVDTAVVAVVETLEFFGEPNVVFEDVDSKNTLAEGQAFQSRGPWCD